MKINGSLGIGTDPTAGKLHVDNANTSFYLAMTGGYNNSKALIGLDSLYGLSLYSRTSADVSLPVHLPERQVLRRKWRVS